MKASVMPENTFNDLSDDEITDKILAVTNKMTMLNNEVKDCNKTKTILDAILLKRMAESNTVRRDSSIASAVIKEQVVPTVTNWDALYNYILTNKDFSLLHRRVSATAFGELTKLGTPVPGLEPLVVHKLTVKQLKKV